MAGSRRHAEMSGDVAVRYGAARLDEPAEPVGTIAHDEAILL